MARPNKTGLDYFPFDIDFFEDEKIEAIFVEFGIKGEITVVKLLCAIYRNGYFIQWNERLRIKLLKNLPGISSELLEKIIIRLVKWDFFNEDLFNSDSILTSKGIQKRFFAVTKRRKQNEDYPYILVDDCVNEINVFNNPINVCNNPTKESKVKNSLSPVRVGESYPSSDILEKTLNDCYQELLNDNSWREPFVMNVRGAGFNDFTLEEFDRYLNLFFAKLQNDGEIMKSAKDAKKHFNSWIRIELKNLNNGKKQFNNRGNSSSTNGSQKTKNIGDIESLQHLADVLDRTNGN